MKHRRSSFCFCFCYTYAWTLLWMWSAIARRSIVSSFVPTAAIRTPPAVAATLRRPWTTPPLAMSSSSAAADTEEPTPLEAGVDVPRNLADVRERIRASCEASGRSPESVRLVAVSKTKPLSYIKEAYYNGGQTVFGENYAQELEEKAAAMALDENYQRDIVWHFIGGLQSNKAAKLVKNVVPHGKLVVETVNSAKVANKLNTAMATNFPEEPPLEVFVQVNTSGEASKSGVTADESLGLCQHVAEDCPHLSLQGVMTIGAPGDAACLERLGACREAVVEHLGLSESSLELSMGMSGDFEAAIEKGSTNVRVGSTIFGQRDYSNQA